MLLNSKNDVMCLESDGKKVIKNKVGCNKGKN
jgi:hypothetical protein